MKHKPAPLLNPGIGYFNMTAYQAFNDGKMTDYIPSGCRQDLCAKLFAGSG